MIALVFVPIVLVRHSVDDPLQRSNEHAVRRLVGGEDHEVSVAWVGQGRGERVEAEEDEDKDDRTDHRMVEKRRQYKVHHTDSNRRILVCRDVDDVGSTVVFLVDVDSVVSDIVAVLSSVVTALVAVDELELTDHLRQCSVPHQSNHDEGDDSTCRRVYGNKLRQNG